MTSDDSPIPVWIAGDGPDADVVITTRARLARGLAGFPFPAKASGEDLTMVARLVREAAAGLTERFPDLRSLRIDALTQESRAYLLDAHIASIEQIAGGEGRVLLVEPRAVLSIMVNEEDHLRIQVVKSGLVPEEVWGIADWADDVLSAGLEYGYSERYGYLTANLSNLGTGLRVSVLMHLAGMAALGRLKAQLRAAYDLGVSVRGLFGEGTRPVGDLFQVSNEMTLGLSEKEIVSRVRSVAQYLLDEERSARKELMGRGRKDLIGAAQRSLDSLRHPRSIASEQAISLMSSLRLASELCLMHDCPRPLLNELMLGMRVGAGTDWGASVERAELLRTKLSAAGVVAG